MFEDRDAYCVGVAVLFVSRVGEGGDFPGQRVDAAYGAEFPIFGFDDFVPDFAGEEEFKAQGVVDLFDEAAFDDGVLASAAADGANFDIGGLGLAWPTS